MFSSELKELLPQVITNWQVLVTAAALVLYMYLVGYVARTYHRPRSVSKSKPKRAKASPAATAKKPVSADADTTEGTAD